MKYILTLEGKVAIITRGVSVIGFGTEKLISADGAALVVDGGGLS